jgi:hypothetical protein
MVAAKGENRGGGAGAYLGRITAVSPADVASVFWAVQSGIGDTIDALAARPLSLSRRFSIDSVVAIIGSGEGAIVVL